MIMRAIIFPSSQHRAAHCASMVADGRARQVNSVQGRLVDKDGDEYLIYTISEADDWYNMHGCHFTEVLLHESCKHVWSWDLGHKMMERLPTCFRSGPVNIQWLP